MSDEVRNAIQTLRRFGHTDVARMLAELCAEIDRLRAENGRLRGFARRIMESWPHGDVDGGELQEIATECGLLSRTEMHKPCGHYCACLDFGAFEGLQDGETVTCYRRTDLLREQQ